MQQNLLLGAMMVTDDINEIMKMTGVIRKAEVYRTLDKLSIRKDYHQALADNNLSIDYIVKGLKDIADKSSDATRLKALQTILKSLGLDSYQGVEGTGSSWEETILKLSEKKEKEIVDGEIVGDEDDDEMAGKLYEVNAPEKPAEEEMKSEEERNLMEMLYEK